MLGLDAPGAPVWLSRSARVARKLPLTLELVEVAGGLVGVNTMHPNRLVEEALRAGLLPELAGYEQIRREVAYDRGCRVDFLLQGGGRPDCFVEVKNVHLKRTSGAEFPDTVTARGARHLKALSREVAKGARAVMLFTWCSGPTAPTSGWPRTSTRATPLPPAWQGTPGSKPGPGVHGHGRRDPSGRTAAGCPIERWSPSS